MCWDCTNHDVDPYKEFTQGGVPIEDFEEEIRYRRPPHHKKKDKVKTRAGCPETNFKSHVYVWTTEGSHEDFFFRYYKYHKYECEICAGCGKKRGSRLTEKYEKKKAREWDKRFKPTAIKRGEPIPRYRRGIMNYRWFSWEDYDEEFAQYKREYREKHGWDKYYRLVSYL